MKTPPFMLTLDGVARSLVWDNATTFRADDCGLADKLAKGKFGYSTLCRMIWVCLDDAGREALPSPEAVARGLPPAAAPEAWTVVMRAYSAGNGTGETDAKKTNGEPAPSPASS